MYESKLRSVHHSYNIPNLMSHILCISTIKKCKSIVKVLNVITCTLDMFVTNSSKYYFIYCKTRDQSYNIYSNFIAIDIICDIQQICKMFLFPCIVLGKTILDLRI